MPDSVDVLACRNATPTSPTFQYLNVGLAFTELREGLIIMGVKLVLDLIVDGTRIEGQEWGVGI